VRRKENSIILSLEIGLANCEARVLSSRTRNSLAMHMAQVLNLSRRYRVEGEDVYWTSMHRYVYGV
jgi:hypothetical protein